jgi:hypothetical protein
MHGLLAELSRRQVARGCLSLLVAALVMIAFPQPALAGTLKVQKIVTGSLSPPTATFGIKVDCVGYPSSTLNLTSGASITLPPKPLFTVCKITEPTLPPPFQANGQFCTYYRVSPPIQSVTINGTTQTVTMLNSYQCQTLTGVLKVLKTVIGALSTQPTTQFTIKTNCPTAQNFVLANGQSGTTPSKLYGTTCTVSEPTLPGPFTANGQTCTWVSPPTQTVTINNPVQWVTVINTYQCQGGTGVLKVTKVVTGSLATQPTTSFTIKTNCPTAQNFNLANGQSGTTPSKLYGTTCTISEPTLPPPFTANGQICTWVLPPTQTVTINNPVQSVTVTNTYQCQVGMGVLQVQKVVTGSLLPPPMTQFSITANCPTPISFNLANTQSGTTPSKPYGTTCTVTESLPPPFQANGQTCTWIQLGLQTVTINSPVVTVIANNTYMCAKK